MPMMTQDETAELYRTALTWTEGDTDRAELLVLSYLRGTLQQVAAPIWTHEMVGYCPTALHA